MKSLLKESSLEWHEYSTAERFGIAAILIYALCVINWFNCRYGIGGIDFESEKVKAWADLIIAILPIFWVVTSDSKRPRAKDERFLGMLLFSFLFFLSYLNFFIRSTPDQIIGEIRVDVRKSIRLYETGGSALDMPSRYEQSETVLLPGIKWMRVVKLVGWREFLPE